MPEHALNQLLNELRERNSEKEPGQPQFQDENYEAIPLTEENFHEIPETDPEDRKTAFIDGGNIPLYSCPSFSVHLVRAYFNLFKNKKRKNPSTIPQQIDFYALAEAFTKDNEIHYEGRTYPVKQQNAEYLPGKVFDFSSWDKTLTGGEFRGDINKVCAAARRFAEWKIAGKIVEKELEENDLIVRDGSLRPSLTGEEEYAKKALAKASENNVVFTGLSKTTRLYTTTGQSLVKIVKDLGASSMPGKNWFYNPVVKNSNPEHEAELSFVKLHPESSYAFRHEIHDQSANKTESTLATLAQNSKDLRFPGYPYGLVDADYFASVSEHEAEQHQAKLKALAVENDVWNQIKTNVTATNAHDRLDELK